MDPRSSQLTFTVFWRDYKFSDNKNTLLRMYYMLNTIISNLNIVTKRVDLQTMLQSRDYHPNFVGEKAGVSDNYFPKFMKLREDPNLGGQNWYYFQSHFRKKKGLQIQVQGCGKGLWKKGVLTAASSALGELFPFGY